MARATKRSRRKRPSQKKLKDLWGTCVFLLARAKSRTTFDRYAGYLRTIGDHGYADAWFALCKAYEKKGRRREARACAQRYFEQGKELAVLELALDCIYADRHGRPEQQRRRGLDPKIGLRALEERAQRGSAEAQFALSEVYDFGGPVRRDERKAVRWLRRAAEAEHLTAMTNLGVRLIEGRGVRMSGREGLIWYRRADRAGCPAASSNIGLCFQQGQGVRRDPKQAVIWFHKAARRGNPIARARIADMEIDGVRVRKDVRHGRRTLKRLSDRGVLLAMERLADRLIDGDGLPKDVRRGRRLRARMEREMDRQEKDYQGP